MCKTSYVVPLQPGAPIGPLSRIPDLITNQISSYLNPIFHLILTLSTTCLLLLLLNYYLFVNIFYLRYTILYIQNIYKLHGFHKLNPSDAVVIITKKGAFSASILINLHSWCKGERKRMCESIRLHVSNSSL